MTPQARRTAHTGTGALHVSCRNPGKSTTVWRRLRWLAVVVGFAIAVELVLGWRAVLAPWGLQGPSFVASTAALMLLGYFIRTLRIQRYFRFGRGFAGCARMVLQHNMLVNLLPMRSGEVAFPVLMKRYFGMPAERSVPALLWLRLLDLHALVFILTIASAFVLPWPVSALLATGMLVLPVMVLPRAARLAAFLGTQGTRPARLIGKALNALPRARAELIEQWLWTIAAWAAKVAAYAWVIATFASVGPTPAVIGAVGGELVSVVPVHGPASLGTYESGIVAAMAPLGVPFGRALHGAVNLHLLVLGVSMLAGLAAFLIPAGVNRGSRESPTVRWLPRPQDGGRAAPATMPRGHTRRAMPRRDA
jgi:uncharacterized membrane protein YbhN (UPF0104 family)